MEIKSIYTWIEWFSAFNR